MMGYPGGVEGTTTKGPALPRPDQYVCVWCPHRVMCSTSHVLHIRAGFGGLAPFAWIEDGTQAPRLWHKPEPGGTAAAVAAAAAAAAAVEQLARCLRFASLLCLSAGRLVPGEDLLACWEKRKAHALQLGCWMP